MEWLVDAQQAGPAAIAWGCYPMVPWAGRIRRGQFRFDGAPHGCRSISAGMPSMAGFTRPWQVERMEAATATLSLALPCDRYWPFGGVATQEVALQPHRLQLSLGPGRRARDAGGAGLAPLVSQARAAAVLAPRDVPAGRGGIATLPAVDPVPGPWDDCFIADSDITLLRGGQRLRLRSDHDHWVVYDGASHATCVEPQSGPPDGFTLAPHRLEPGQRLALTFELAWSVDSA
jgi:aldose 1-epimerase